jgi:peptidoglycan-N-acetylglucosamine deacetylase
MSMALLIFAFFLLANLIALLFLFIGKARGRAEFKRVQLIRGALSDAVLLGDRAGLERLVSRHPEEALMLWRDMRATLTFSADAMEPIQEIFRSTGIEKKLFRLLRSAFALKRFRAALVIRPLVAPSNMSEIIRALAREKREFIKLALAKNLIDSGDQVAFDGIARSLERCSVGYFKSVRAMLASAGPRFIGWAHSRIRSEEAGIRIAILAGAKSHVTKWLKAYVKANVGDDDPMVRSTALETAEYLYPDILADAAYRPELDIVSRRVAIRCLAQISYPLDVERFISFFADPSVQDIAVQALAGYLSAHPEEVERAAGCIQQAADPDVRRGLAVALAHRLPYLLVSSEDINRCKPIVEGMIEAGKSAAIIAFLNANRNALTEELLLQWLKPYLDTRILFREECAAYLNEELRDLLGIQAHELPKSSRKIPLTRADRVGLSALLALIILIPVAGMAIGLAGATIGRAWIVAREVFRQFTWWFGYYSVSLNCIYILLLVFAQKKLRSQAAYWQLLDKEYLFTPGMLPSISILAPAYNEEKTVVQSVHSLLTLEYPDFEVIVINDGSADGTMDTLMREFELERIDPAMSAALPTAPIRGVYRSPSYAKLLVIDKENGGKADALNTGINLARCDYLCSIDSDSLLEPDALLRMTAQIITSDIETIAVGGNILPVNGCTVERGMLQSIALSKNSVAGLQTIEYLRSFIAGRLGWSSVNALLIISGAFGLFRRDRVLEIGGYMTGRGEFNRDTVGEDMELVVRLVRRMGDTRRPYRVRYASSANCWTEVPEDMRSLYKQRDRWHRGLVEIMTWHRKMLFNPKYGTAGLLAFPYFLIFELIGPFYEFAGYPFLIIGFVTGALHWHIFLIMFSAVMLFGLLISIISLGLSERGIVYFRHKELASLLGYSLIENFGFRQLMGWSRVFSSVSLLFKNKGWQKLERKGFSAVAPIGGAAAKSKP